MWKLWNIRCKSAAGQLRPEHEHVFSGPYASVLVLWKQARFMMLPPPVNHLVFLTHSSSVTAFQMWSSSRSELKDTENQADSGGCGQQEAAKADDGSLFLQGHVGLHPAVEQCQAKRYVWTSVGKIWIYRKLKAKEWLLWKTPAGSRFKMCLSVMCCTGTFPVISIPMQAMKKTTTLLMFRYRMLVLDFRWRYLRTTTPNTETDTLLVSSCLKNRSHRPQRHISHSSYTEKQTRSWQRWRCSWLGESWLLPWREKQETGILCQTQQVVKLSRFSGNNKYIPDVGKVSRALIIIQP